MTRVRLLAVSVSALALAAGVLALSQPAGGPSRAHAAGAEPPTPPGETYRSPVAPEKRRVFFGELHLHTTMSLDAWTYGTKVTPDQAYKFARGEPVIVPAVQVKNEEGITSGDVSARRAWPLDFAAVTDHSEYLGAMHQLDDPQSAFSKSATGQAIQSYANDLERRGNVGQAIGRTGAAGRQAVRDATAASNGWAVEMKAANDNYRPGTFTTFVAYEWSARGDAGGTMHRNVIFNAAQAPSPFTADDSNKPEALWKYLEATRAKGIDVIAIPHNSNLSRGHDFDWNMSDGRPIDESYALERAANEPLVEMGQHKGTSETRPELSMEDEFANFELVDAVRGEHGSYVREAYGRGLIIQSKVGANPFKMGVVGGSDIHNGLSVSDESAYAGSGPYGIDPKTMLPAREVAEKAMSSRERGAAREEGGKFHPVQFSPGSLTGVWAEENTRNAIFAALKRKETFATSGTRIRLRMFGGWGFDPAAIRRADWVKSAYASGVPMGSDLPARPQAAKAPRFVLQAMKDPAGANLDRIQVIKVWLKPDGTYGEKVFDAVLSGGRKVDPKSGKAPAIGDTVDLKTATYRNSIGAASLATVWQDPEFDPRTAAVYYARALEIPTPRWSTILAVKEKLPLPTAVPATIQERAWSSPIWFTPPVAGRGRAAGP
ncbi:DUF3604 domain-containing protein [Phenylobacterium sp.]|jgi:hypothetical protein|uniref:DUF3604 domain-containing protein n=1 Tax=Phenylobacterium sp. TaxID=1871053 RepID=UPI002F41638A